jgi:hypothetical protein
VPANQFSRRNNQRVIRGKSGIEGAWCIASSDLLGYFLRLFMDFDSQSKKTDKNQSKWKKQ